MRAWDRKIVDSIRAREVLEFELGHAEIMDVALAVQAASVNHPELMDLAHLLGQADIKITITHTDHV